MKLKKELRAVKEINEQVSNFVLFATSLKVFPYIRSILNC